MKTYLFWVRAAIVFCGLGLFSQVSGILLPILIAIILAFILNPVVEQITKIRLGSNRLCISRGVGVVLAIALFIIAVPAVMAFIFVPFNIEFNRFLANLPYLIAKLQFLTGDLEQKALALQLPANIQVIVDQVLAGSAAYAIELGKKMLTATVGFASQVIELVVVPVLTYYFLKDWRLLKNAVIGVFPPAGQTKADAIIGDMAQVMSAYLRGQAMISAIMGTLVFIGMALLGVDYPIVLGLLSALTETIPIIGPIIGSAPALFLAFLISPALAMKVLIFYIVLHQVDSHIIVPNIMGHKVAIHPVAVIISFLIGAQLLGIIGMMLAVPAVALLNVLVKHLWNFE